jgi:hypothetical protein
MQLVSRSKYQDNGKAITRFIIKEEQSVLKFGMGGGV